MKKDYEHLATLFVERYGIIDYKVKGNSMVYYEWDTIQVEPLKRVKYKHIVNLDTMEETSQQLYNRKK